MNAQTVSQCHAKDITNLYSRALPRALNCEVRLALPQETGRSCGGDVEDDGVVELDDSPGTTNGTKFSVLQRV